MIARPDGQAAQSKSKALNPALDSMASSARVDSLTKQPWSQPTS